ARRKTADTRTSDPKTKRVARDESRPRSPRFRAGRNVRGCRGVRSGDRWRPRDFREAASIRRWNEARVCERRAGLEGWRAHGSEAGQGDLGTGENEISAVGAGSASFRIYARFNLIERRIVLPDPLLNGADFGWIDGRGARFAVHQVRR